MRTIVLCALLVIASAVAVFEYQRLYAPVGSGSPYRAFTGTWRLVSSVELLPDGSSRPYAFGPHAQGYLMYDSTGHVCAQVVDPGRPRWADQEHPTGSDLLSAYNGFGGYCGSYTVDEYSHTAAHIPEVAFDPNLVAQPKPRSYRFENDKLIYSGTEKLQPTGESHWTMTWQKVK
jgi:hypothetical protein